MLCVKTARALMFSNFAEVCAFTIVHFLVISEVSLLPSVIRIGGIFNENKKSCPSELAFKYAVHSINKDKGILPETTLHYDVQYVPGNDSFRATKKVCNQIKLGVHAIFGPSDGITRAHVHSICDALDIPHIESRLDFDNKIREFSINLYPAQHYVNMAFQDVIRYLNWTKVGILFEKHCGLIQFRDLIRASDLEMYIREVEPSTYMQVLNELKNKEINNIVIDTSTENITILLKGILQLQMNEYKYHYLFTSFDIETFELDDFKYNFVNITAFRLVDIGDVSVKEILKDMENFNQLIDNGGKEFRKVRMIETEPALMYDSVYIFAIGLQTLDLSHTLKLSNLSCSEESPWDGGLSLINYINSVEWKGLTGPIQFKEGHRTQFKLDLVKLKQHSIVKVGEWSPQTRLNITDQKNFFESGSMNVTLVVITILETPYVMMHYEKNFTGNERFYGFCVDILDLVAREAGFDYILDLVPDRKYGAKDPVTGEWNGMVAQLMKYKADLAVGSMTINYARESVIDFTKPFMNLGISILFKVPTTPPSRLFSFMNPLAFEIWLYVLAAYFLVSLTIYTVARFSPYELHDLNPCNVEDESIGNQFTIGNSFWFTIGTLMQQGSDICPKAASTRIVSAIWWFFTLIMISSYTANLAAFLTVERMITPIENADDLATQTDISYGTLESGSTMTFFRVSDFISPFKKLKPKQIKDNTFLIIQDSMIETYRKMWRFMENKKPSVFTTTYEEGIKRVLEGNYAFLMESTMLDYIVQRDCNLTQIGGLLDAKGYGIATPMGSPWRDKISLTILELQEKGEIQMLYDKWWKNSGETCVRTDKSKQSKANALGLDNIGGVFVVLLCGLIVAVCMSIYEFRQHHQENSKRISLNEASDDVVDSISDVRHDPNRVVTQTLCEEMANEFCFALQCLGPRQRPALKRQCSKCAHLHSTIDVKDNLGYDGHRNDFDLQDYAKGIQSARISKPSIEVDSEETVPPLDAASTGKLLSG